MTTYQEASDFLGVVVEERPPRVREFARSIPSRDIPNTLKMVHDFPSVVRGKHYN